MWDMNDQAYSRFERFLYWTVALAVAGALGYTQVACAPPVGGVVGVELILESIAGPEGCGGDVGSVTGLTLDLDRGVVVELVDAGWECRDTNPGVRCDKRPPEGPDASLRVDLESAEMLVGPCVFGYRVEVVR
jgi:hypothetical protein